MDILIARIKERIAELKERELRHGLTTNENIELGKLYIVEEINEKYSLEIENEELERWKARALELEEENKELKFKLNYNQ